jgi:hypothetical protein
VLIQSEGCSILELNPILPGSEQGEGNREGSWMWAMAVEGFGGEKQRENHEERTSGRGAQ